MKIWELLKVENIGKYVKSELGEFKVVSNSKWEGNVLIEQNMVLCTKQDLSIFSIPTDKINIEWEIIEEEENTDYERAEYNNQYYYVTSHGKVWKEIEKNISLDNTRHKIANYSTVKSKMEFKALRDNLLSRMQRWADIHNEEKIDWNDSEQRKYLIYYDYDDNKFYFTYVYYIRDLGQVYFTSKEIANQCLEEFKEELLEFYKFEMEE